MSPTGLQSGVHRRICKDLWERLKEHIRAPFSNYDLGNISGHHIRMNNFSIAGREAHNITMTMKEAMYIRVNDPSLNGITDMFQLAHI